MTTTEIRQQQLALYSQIPEGIRCGLIHSIVFGYPPGGFLNAVFSNDLMEAFGRADENSARGMKALLTWINSFAPRDCWGSRESRDEWAANREELLPHCSGLRTGLEIFAELGDALAVEALTTIKVLGASS